MPGKGKDKAQYPDLPMRDMGVTGTTDVDFSPGSGLGVRPFVLDSKASGKQPTVESDSESEGSNRGRRPESPTTKSTHEADNSDGDEPIETYTPSESIAETKRILKQAESAYYEILNVPENASQAEIKKAYKSRSLLTHEDRSVDGMAKEAMIKVNSAYDVLRDDVKRKHYDSERPILKKYGGLKEVGEWDEVFAKGAYEYDDDDRQPEEVEEEKPISEQKKALLKEVESAIKTVLLNPSKKEPGDFAKQKQEEADKMPEGRDKDLAKLYHLNQALIQCNITDGLFPTEDSVPIGYLLKTARKREKIMQEDNAYDKLCELKQALQSWLIDLELPDTWTFEIPPKETFSSTSRNSGSRENDTSSSRKNDTSSSRRNDTSSSRRNDTSSSTNRSPGFRENDQSNQQRGESGRPVEPEASQNRRERSPSPEAMEVDWVPGEQTTRGEKILAYTAKRGAAYDEESGQLKSFSRPTAFVIEIPGPRRIRIVGVARVGREAANAYMQKSKNKNLLTNISDRYDRDDGDCITAVKGYDQADAGDTLSANRPWTVLLVKYNSEYRVLNRTALTKACGSRRAQQMIDLFLITIDELPEPGQRERLLLRDAQIGYQLQIAEAKDNLEEELQARRKAMARKLLIGSQDGDPDSESDSLFVSERSAPRYRHKSRSLESRGKSSGGNEDLLALLDRLKDIALTSTENKRQRTATQVQALDTSSAHKEEASRNDDSMQMILDHLKNMALAGTVANSKSQSNRRVRD